MQRDKDCINENSEISNSYYERFFEWALKLILPEIASFSNWTSPQIIKEGFCGFRIVPCFFNTISKKLLILIFDFLSLEPGKCIE